MESVSCPDSTHKNKIIFYFQGSTIVNITVLDVNDNDPSFINKSYVFTHLEGMLQLLFTCYIHPIHNFIYVPGVLFLVDI